MKSYIKIFALLLCISYSSCSWLDIEPEGEATDKKLYKTGDGYRTALAGVYSQMASRSLYGLELQFGYIDCLSQQYDWTWNSRGFGQDNASVYQRISSFEYQNDVVLRMTDAIWETGYNAIANANNLITQAEAASPSLFEYKEMERSMILGEAYACRALMHFDLCRLFTPAPIENDNTVLLPYVKTYPDIQPEGIDVSTYLDNVVADFEKAAELTLAYDTTALGMGSNASWRARFENEKESGFETKLPSGEVPESFLKNRGYRLTHHAIKALLARVYLYMGNYDKALEYATFVWEAKAKGIEGSGNEMEMYKNEEWYHIAGTNDPEQKRYLRMPWSIIFALDNENAYNDYNIEFHFKKVAERNAPGQWFLLALKRQNIFENKSTNADEYEQDYRGQSMLFTPNYDGFFGREPLHVYSLKLFPSSNTLERNKTLNKSPIIRTSELLYIIAECHARKGDFAGAYEVLNRLREMRGLRGTPLPVAGDFDTFARDLVNDAQREWISEGQLFYLYKRLKFPCVGDQNERRPMNKSEYMPPIPVNQNF
ncbi:RagB/SusD family nutrient uptake outer membrane protein [Porphyromonas sp.]|uniref:RagB/SusD family nutrient uptake outer membrane protein n=1 Tax=Porphyromonas sp. TaxID=1924944 RepID=UPI0026DAE422|nr:RagB/SusD family nutrient uptake outer membrane protein [Porphyromonas sp.]MDO4770414.1 RagB/SusD family nutrient uptake outer membrane protein [Porphyromonas sp.]